MNEVPATSDPVPALAVGSRIVPANLHESIAGQAASQVDNHAMHVAAEIDGLIRELERLKDRVIAGATQARGVINEQAAVCETAQGFTQMVRRALDAREDSKT